MPLGQEPFIRPWERGPAIEPPLPAGAGTAAAAGRPRELLLAASGSVVGTPWRAPVGFLSRATLLRPHPGPHHPVPSRYLSPVPISLSPEGCSSWSPFPAGALALLPLSYLHPVPLHPVPSRYLVRVPSPHPHPHQGLHHPVPVPTVSRYLVSLRSLLPLSITLSSSPLGASLWPPSPCPVPSRCSSDHPTPTMAPAPHPNLPCVL